MTVPSIGSLCTGYGGLDIAVRNVFGGRLAFVADNAKAQRQLLTSLHPEVQNLGDFTATEWSGIGRVDVLTAGYPCQPFSVAGNRKGVSDARHLWPHVRSAIRALGPSLVVLENVRGHLSLGFGDVLADLADLGMSARWGVVKASDVGAPHRRARLFVIAWPPIPESDGRERSRAARGWRYGLANSCRIHAADADIEGPQRERSSIQGGGAISASTASDAERHGHGQQLRAGRMAGMEEGKESQAQERERPRRVADPTVDWGVYSDAITRWSGIIGRPPPPQTVPGASGRERLSPRFVEWMMGLDDGHVTGRGLSPTKELETLGNGVVPQQAEYAIRLLTEGTPWQQQAVTHPKTTA